MLPAPEAIIAILFKPRRGPVVGWKVDRSVRLSTYTETEWTVYSQEGEEEDPPKDPPEDPEDPEDPEEPEDPGDDDDEEGEEGCTPPPCGGLIDPWTCECYPDMKDPWGSEISSQEIVLSM